MLQNFNYKLHAYTHKIPQNRFSNIHQQIFVVHGLDTHTHARTQAQHINRPSFTTEIMSPHKTLSCIYSRRRLSALVVV